jgi:hypothetical protein
MIKSFVFKQSKELKMSKHIFDLKQSTNNQNKLNSSLGPKSLYKWL